jgi:hypothetical protein
MARKLYKITNIILIIILQNTATVIDILLIIHLKDINYTFYTANNFWILRKEITKNAERSVMKDWRWRENTTSNTDIQG